MLVYIKGNSKQYIKDGRIVGYVGEEVAIGDINISNGWLLQGEYAPVNSVPRIHDHGFSQNRYNALVSAGINPVDASRVTGYVPQ